MPAVLGISAQYHDAAACLVVDGEIVAAAQEERFSRKKHDPSLPVAAARDCLLQAGIGPSDLAALVFYEKPLRKLDRILETHLAIAPRGAWAFARAVPLTFRERLFVGDDLAAAIGSDAPVLYSEHHAAHAASAFYPSPFDEAAILTIDGVGEWATGSWGVGRSGEIRLLREQRFPHSLGLLYAAFTSHLGFEVNDGEYKVMGLAPHGEPRFLERILQRVVDLKEDGSLRLDTALLRFLGGRAMTGRAFEALFGPRRRAGEPIDDRHRDLARSIQAVTEEVVLRQARALHATTRIDRVCLAGGVALNAVANGRLLREGPFREVWVQPAASDAGGAIGAALLGSHAHLGVGRPVRPPGEDGMRGALLGPAFSAERIAAAIDEAGLERRPATADDVAAELAGGRLVALFDGRMEIGPRALGARSILADPSDERVRDVLNLRVKHREPFRPFAPCVLAEDAARLFAIDRPSPYMTFVFAATEEGHRQAAAALHVDGTARVQTVCAAASPALHAVLRSFRERTGRSALLNTSFNRAGEPIVCTPADAIRTFVECGLDALAIGPWLVPRPASPDAVRLPPPPAPPRTRRWLEILRAIGARQARFLLVVAYYLVVTPYALVGRLFREDPLARRLDRSAGGTTMVDRTEPLGPMDRMF